MTNSRVVGREILSGHRNCARFRQSDLGDEEFVRGIYERAEQKFDAPADALVLARDVLEVSGNRDRAAGLFKTCLAGTDGFADLGKLLDTVRAGVSSDELNREVLTKLAAAAQNPTELLSTADRAIDVLEDRELAASLLDRAEERVTTLPEMKGVVEAVDRYLAAAEEKASTPLEVCHVGTKFAEIGERGKAAALYGSAVSKCGTAGDCVRLVTSFRDLGLGEKELREHYMSGGKSLSAGEKLRWAEGILELFGDKGWAEREYEGMAGSFSAPDDQALYRASQKIHFGRTF